jgi:hypothetical protein
MSTQLRNFSFLVLVLALSFPSPSVSAFACYESYQCNGERVYYAGSTCAACELQEWICEDYCDPVSPYINDCDGEPPDVSGTCACTDSCEG